jgi:hypothetical protein
VRALFLTLLLCCCSSNQLGERCLAEDDAAARGIAAQVTGTAPDDDSLQVSDEGDRWRVGRYAETWLEGDMIMSRDAGFSLRIDNCSGAVSEYRSWP